MSEGKDKQIERGIEELRTSEDRYHKMIDQVEDYAIILLDKQGIIQNWNRGAQKIKLYTEAEAVGRSFTMFYRPEDLQTGLPLTLMDSAVRNGRALHEGWRVRKDGTHFWGSVTLTALHDDEGELTGFSKVTRDLTERRAAEEALRLSEERYHRMIAEVQDYAILLLNEQGDIQNWNEGAQRIKQYTPAEAIGKNFRIFYTKEDQQNQLPERLLSQAVHYGKALHEGWRLRKDGSRFWGSVVITALHNSEGAILGFSKVTRDLTEKKEAEIKLQAYVTELEMRNRELEQFAYIASHDLQEPLRKIRMFISLIPRYFHQPSMMQDYFSRIEQAAGRMSELIRSVLNYSKLSGVDESMEPTDLNQVLEHVLSDFELMVGEKKAHISSEPLPVVIAINSQMHQLFANLISNALKFSTKDPLIKISSRIVAKSAITELPEYLTSSHYLELTFEDNGIGFEQQYEKLMFSMFQRLHDRNTYAGTGIGLALCKKIMDNHSGLIRASSKPGQGAVFHVYLPHRI